MIISLNIGKPLQIEWEGNTYTTSIFKSPINDRRKVTFQNIEGDEQSDLKNHGGRDKAVYSYSIEYYDFWKKIIQRDNWKYGIFGENLTTRGILDDEVKVGNIYRVGTAHLQAIQPRFPCFKLNIRFGMKNIAELFKLHKKHGIYYRVVKEGYIRAGDEFILIEESPGSVTIQDMVESRAANQGS